MMGISGAGKSFFASKLGSIFGIPVHHLDKLYWLPGWVEPDKEQFHGRVFDVSREESWIIDGNCIHSLEMRFEKAYLCIYLKLPKLLVTLRGWRLNYLFA